MFSRLIFIIIVLTTIYHDLYALDVETLHFESGCLSANTGNVHLRLACPNQNRIKLVRLIYGYNKETSPSLSSSAVSPLFPIGSPLTQKSLCSFSIYDCIQEGHNTKVLSCNGLETCTIELTKQELLSTTTVDNSNKLPICQDFNYVQINYACVSEKVTRDICDIWKDESPILHISHTMKLKRNSSNRKRLKLNNIVSVKNNDNRCHCKIRSSLSNGQVLLQVIEMKREGKDDVLSVKKKFQSIKQQQSAPPSDCKQTTYLEIATDRLERKCMDMSSSGAIFGSGSHNFTLTYMRGTNINEAELLFWLEVRASPPKTDHNVQIICNWSKRKFTSTTTTVTAAPLRKRLTVQPKPTIDMNNAIKQSRLDLIQLNNKKDVSDSDIKLLTEEETPARLQTDDDELFLDAVAEPQHLDSENEIISNNDALFHLGKAESENEEEKQEQALIEEETLEDSTKSSYKRRKTTLTSTFSISLSEQQLESDDPQWRQLLQLNDNSQFLYNNRPIFTQTPAITREHRSSSVPIVLLLIVIIIVVIALSLYCLKVKRPDFMRRIILNGNVAVLFCCEAVKFLVCSTKASRSTATSPANTIHRHYRSELEYRTDDYSFDDEIESTTVITNNGGGDTEYGRSTKRENYPTIKSNQTLKSNKYAPTSIYSIDNESLNYTGKYDFGSPAIYDQLILNIILFYYLESMSQDSLTNGQNDEGDLVAYSSEPPSTTNSRISKVSWVRTSNDRMNGRVGLDEHIKLVKQKKEEAEVLRLQKFQEQLKKKEQK
ncbi:unnamed protein product, partial [Didymodactylos carnosus]